ncbi:lipoyl(octanoyl) transferase LipB [Thiomicrospira pelophila]|uniref:lipoyl(octanoyl) transferase LipB n=1 Tax=Thiomicrospira pelophila TaxID=934 RepID=UPI00056FD2AE|nr:lipoyl(octanoyl) transferase LipB [Thiomicrospira pelophila]
MSIEIKNLGLQDYQSTWQAMQDFTAQRHVDTPDQIWLVEHPPVYTQGLNGQPEHIQQSLGDIPLVQSDRGGQITYHAPGQLIVYTLIDLKRRHLGVRALVSLLENACIAQLTELGISAQSRKDAPGIYVNSQKIASLGLKIKRQCSYHGLALNVNMDLSPFQRITPCGLSGMQMTQVSLYNSEQTVQSLAPGLVDRIQHGLLNWPIISHHLNNEKTQPHPIR